MLLQALERADAGGGAGQPHCLLHRGCGGQRPGISVIAGEGYIDNVAVREEYRRQGIAQALLDVFLRFGKAHQLAFLTLEVRASNDPAKQLYMKHGFEQVGRRKDYYDEPNEDAIIMTKYFQAEQPDENDE